MVEEKANRNFLFGSYAKECGPGQPPEPHEACPILLGPLCRFAVVPRGIRSWLASREDADFSAVAGLDTCHIGGGRVSSLLAE